jgi:hypothetical protein
VQRPLALASSANEKDDDMNAPWPDQDETLRAWRVQLKPGYKGDTPAELTVRAERLDAVTQLGLVFKNRDVVVEVVPFGSFARASAVDPRTGAFLHSVRVTVGTAQADD